MNTHDDVQLSRDERAEVAEVLGQAFGFEALHEPDGTESADRAEHSGKLRQAFARADF